MVEKEIERDKEACNMKHVLPVVKVSIYFQYIKRRHYGYIYIYTTSKLIVSVCNKLEGMWKEAAVICFIQQHLIRRIVKKHAYNQYNLKSDRYSKPGPPE